MTTNNNKVWASLRSPLFYNQAKEIIKQTSLDNFAIISIEHIRTSHYSVYKVTDNNNNAMVVRIGVANSTDFLPANNSGYLDTSIYNPTGQYRESIISQKLFESDAYVIPTSYYSKYNEFDVTWAPFISGDKEYINATQWHETLSNLFSYKPDMLLPLFTNRIKSMNRLKAMSKSQDITSLEKEYNESLKKFFDVATSWSLVHGDAHAGNALIFNSKALLYDFDTVCWAPSVWDLTHLINRAGQGDNIGYSVDELIKKFEFSNEEIESGLSLRKIASRIAKDYSNFSQTKVFKT